MKKHILFLGFILLVSIFINNSLFSQNSFQNNSNGELYIKITLKNKTELSNIIKWISIDSKTKPNSNVIYAYVNEKGFSEILKNGILFEVLRHPSDLIKEPKMYSGNNKEIYAWDAYPVYQTYLDMMTSFETNYNHLCKIFTTGYSISGRKIQFARITNSLNNIDKPRVMLSGAIHGDEVVGYITLLRLCDYLISHYETDSSIANLLNSVEIWINPLANPDGTYAGGNNTIIGSTRFNANHVDINRNYPDFLYGSHPDGNSTQAETQAVIHLTDSLQFVMGFTFHSGAEVLNYPWDNQSVLPADDNWWQYICKNYADTVFAHSQTGYFTGLSSTGYINGYNWYMITGGKQDYLNYFKHVREITIEISNTKIPDAATLPYYWEANYRSIINFIKEAQFGIRGIVLDSATNIPLKTKILISGHDLDNSFVISDSVTGFFYRPIFENIYPVSFMKNGYSEKTLLIQAVNKTAVFYTVALSQSSGIDKINIEQDIEIYPNPATDKLFIKNIKKESVFKIKLFNLDGATIKPELSAETFNKSDISISISDLNSGVYFIEIITESNHFFKKITIIK